MKLSEIIEVIEKSAPLGLAAAWDNCGMQVASLKQNIKSMALCLDPSPASVEQAINDGAELILSHHPLLMEGRLPATLDQYHQVLRLLFTHDTALYAAHTSLDVNPYGPVGWLGRALGLKNTQVLEPVGEISNKKIAGFGLVGNLKKALNYEELLNALQAHINIDTSTLCGELPKQIKRVAYCTGSGSSLMQKAHAQNADIFITGDVKYHSALESPLCTLDVGHHSLEEEMMRQFSLDLVKLLPKVSIKFISSASPLRLANTQ